MLHEGHWRAAILVLLSSCRWSRWSQAFFAKPAEAIVPAKLQQPHFGDTFSVALRWTHLHETQTQSQMSLRFSLVRDRHSQSFYRLPEKWIQYIQYKCVFHSVLQQERPVHFLLSASLSNGPVFVTFTVWKCLDLPQERGYWLFS